MVLGTIEHFLHPGHALYKVNDSSEFVCGGCKTSGNDIRYRCNACPNTFDMHEYCATCPSAVTGSFMHPQHQLSLVVRKAHAAGRQNERLCDVCGDGIEGLFYRCKTCDFDVHPICTRLPEHVSHALHPEHTLRLEPSQPGCCAVCRGTCTSWRYKCRACCVDIHAECVLVPLGSFHDPPSSSSSVPRSAPYGGGYGYNYAGNNMHGGYGHSVPYGGYYGPQNTTFSGNQVPGSGGNGGGQKIIKRMSSLVGKLTVGVITNVVFGAAFSS